MFNKYCNILCVIRAFIYIYVGVKCMYMYVHMYIHTHVLLNVPTIYVLTFRVMRDGVGLISLCTI